MLENLSLQDLLILGFLAELCIPIEEAKLFRTLSRLTGMTPKAVATALDPLIAQRYVNKKRNAYYWRVETEYCIDERWVLPVLIKLRINQPAWIDKYKVAQVKIINNQRQQDSLLAVVNCMAMGTPMPTDLRITSYLSLVRPYLLPCVQYEVMDPYLKHLPDYLLADILPEYIGKLINNDSGVGAERLLRLTEEVGTSTTKCLNLHGQVALYYVMEKGCLPERYSNLAKLGGYGAAATAVLALHERDYDKAFLAFKTAMMAISRTSFSWFDYPLLNLLLVISMIQSDLPEAKRVLTVTSKECLYISYSAKQPASLLVALATDEAFNDALPLIEAAYEAAPKEGWIAQKLADMMRDWLEIPLAKIRKSLLPGKGEEIVYYADATRLANELLHQVKIKSPWEKAIDQVMSSEEKIRANLGSRMVEDTRQERIAYFYVRGSYLEIREQKRLKSGKWSAGKLLSETSFIYKEDALLDDLDRSVRSVYKKHRYDEPTFRELLPLFVGYDKLFVGTGAPYTQCTVHEEKPFLTANIGKQQITLASNVPLAELENQEATDVLYAHNPEGVISFFRVPQRVRNILRILTKVSSFPLESEPQLKLMFDQIRDIIEIHSEMIEGGSTLPTCEGDPRIILQATPQRGDYLVKALVRPLPEGRLTELPGQGEKNLFDQTSDGTRYQVIRNKRQEKKNLEALEEQLEQIAAYEVETCLWDFDPYSMLELMEWLPDQENIVLEWPEGKKIKLNVADPSKWNISLSSHGGWFDVEGEVPVDGDTILNIGQLLELMGEGRGRFIRLKDDQYLSLTDSLRRQLSRLDAVAQTSRGKTRISSLAAGLIGDAMNGELTIDHPKKIDDLREKIRASQELQAEVPSTLNATLRDYQEEGFRWIDRLSSWGAGACLADDMGLGKTVQTIAFLLHKQEQGASLVVAPASVVPNWRKELARFAPTLQTVVLNELVSDDRKEAVRQAEAGTVIVSTYGLLMSEEEAMVGKEWNVICLDEAHSIKNSTTKTSAVCMKLEAKHRLILTGTPIQNHLGELWNLFQFINPGLLGSFEQFTKKYINPIEGAHDKARQQQLKRIVQPFMLRRTKQEVVAELPDKQEITLPIQLSTEEMAIYELIRMEAKQQLESESGTGGLSVNSLAMITKLRMAACSASLAHKNWTGPSSKLDAFCDLVNEICTSGNRVLVFSQFTTFLEMAKIALERRGMKDYLYLDGSTPIKKRSEMVDAFQKGKCPLFIISLKAGGLGLNLTGANYVIHLDPWWNPAIEQQATDRAYRIGQEQKVTVYHLISEHTIEEKIVRLHQTKRDLADSLLDGTDMSHKLSAADLLDMIEER